MESRSDERSLGQLFGDLSRQLSTLIRQEITLARTEMTSQLGSAGRGAAMIGAGGALAHAALLGLLVAIALLLIDAGITPWLAALIVAIVTAAAGGALIAYGRTEIQRTDLTPRRTIDTIRDDADWAKERVK
jgi:putative superfamily III holin-X